MTTTMLVALAVLFCLPFALALAWIICAQVMVRRARRARGLT